MAVIRGVRALQARADAERAAGRRVALVPTMGALPAGPLSLVELARQRADRVWLSIFVNPAQFDDPLDLARYPRVMDDDLEAALIGSDDDDLVEAGRLAEQHRLAGAAGDAAG